MTPESKLADWMARKHERVCVDARTCTCHDDLAAARKLAAHVHRRYEHPGTVETCQSPHDVICKAVW